MIYLLNTLLITNKRIIENTQAGLFRHTINELSTDKIQDISVQTFGPLAALLGYGNIEIQTAGTQAKFRFTFLPDPQKIKQTIFHTNVPA